MKFLKMKNIKRTNLIKYCYNIAILKYSGLQRSYLYSNVNNIQHFRILKIKNEFMFNTIVFAYFFKCEFFIYPEI